MSNQSSSSGIGDISSVLGIVFIVLKLTGDIDWSWWWVFAPFWLPIALAIIVLIVFIVINYFFQLLKG